MLNHAAVTSRRSLYGRSVGQRRHDRRRLPTGRRSRPTGGGASPMLVLAAPGPKGTRRRLARSVASLLRHPAPQSPGSFV